MSKRAVRRLALPLWCLTAAFAQAAGGIKVHMHGDATYAADGFLYMPAAQAPLAAVVLIPGEDGITQRVTDAAAVLADAGFVAVAVDLNRGLPPAGAAPSAQQIREDLDSALSFLAGQSGVRSKLVGALGFGSGGRYALELASSAKVRAVAIEAAPPYLGKPAPLARPIAVLTISPAQARDAVRLEQAFFSKELAIAP